MSREIYKAFLPLYKSLAKMNGEKVFALTEVVKTNRSGTSYAVYRRARPTRAIVKLGIYGCEHRQSGNRGEILPKQRFAEFRAKVSEFQSVFGNRL